MLKLLFGIVSVRRHIVRHCDAKDYITSFMFSLLSCI